MSDYCRYPNQCAPGMDCSPCYQRRIATLVRQLAEREKTEQDLWEKLNCQDNEIDDLKRQLEDTTEID